MLSAWGGPPLDCGDRYQPEHYGVHMANPAVVRGALAVEGYQPYALHTQPSWAEQAEYCRFSSPYDVFRLDVSLEGASLLAGCAGNFKPWGHCLTYHLLPDSFSRMARP